MFGYLCLCVCGVSITLHLTAQSGRVVLVFYGITRIGPPNWVMILISKISFSRCVCVCAYVFLCICAHVMRVCLSVLVYPCVRVCVSVCTCMFVYTCMSRYL